MHAKTSVIRSYTYSGFKYKSCVFSLLKDNFCYIIKKASILNILCIKKLFLIVEFTVLKGFLQNILTIINFKIIIFNYYSYLFYYK